MEKCWVAGKLLQYENYRYEILPVLCRTGISIFVRQNPDSMEAKLTIRLSKSIYEDVKMIARNQRITVTRYILNLLNRDLKSSKRKKYRMQEEIEISPLVQSMIGVAKGPPMTKAEIRKAMAEHWQEKHKVKTSIKKGRK